NPPGAPSPDVAKFVWALSLQEVKYLQGHLQLDLDARFDDTKYGRGITLPQAQMAKGLANLTNQKHPNADLVFSLNQGVLNRVIQLSSERGYFNEIKMDSGEAIKLTKIPYMNFSGSKGPKMGLEIEYTVTGFSAVFVKNPIRINFDLNLGFPI